MGSADLFLSAVSGRPSLPYGLAALALLFVGALAWMLARRNRDLRRALATEQRCRHAITDSQVEGLFVCDAQGRARIVNLAAEQMLGWKAEELRGHMLHDRIHRFHADGRPYPASECPILEVLEHGRPLQVEDEVFTHRDGRLIPVSYSVAPMRDPDGRIIDRGSAARSRPAYHLRPL